MTETGRRSLALVRTELGSDEFYRQFPSAAVMSAESLVSASLAGLELVCIPVLESMQAWFAANAAIR
jgi:hypothetical protein